jgi:thermostable 8-oxoguanine DNA glycosylase
MKFIVKQTRNRMAIEKLKKRKKKKRKCDELVFKGNCKGLWVKKTVHGLQAIGCTCVPYDLFS